MFHHRVLLATLGLVVATILQAKVWQLCTRNILCLAWTKKNPSTATAFPTFFLYLNVTRRKRTGKRGSLNSFQLFTCARNIVSSCCRCCRYHRSNVRCLLCVDDTCGAVDEEAERNGKRKRIEGNSAKSISTREKIAEVQAVLVLPRRSHTELQKAGEW